MKIRIINTLPGQAPEDVRKQWVGLEFNINTKQAAGIQTGTLGGKPQNLGGHKVDGHEAIKTLREKSPEAADWWEQNIPGIHGVELVFAQAVCEIIES